MKKITVATKKTFCRQCRSSMKKEKGRTAMGSLLNTNKKGGGRTLEATLNVSGSKYSNDEGKKENNLRRLAEMLK